MGCGQPPRARTQAVRPAAGGGGEACSAAASTAAAASPSVTFWWVSEWLATSYPSRNRPRSSAQSVPRARAKRVALAGQPSALRLPPRMALKAASASAVTASSCCEETAGREAGVVGAGRISQGPVRALTAGARSEAVSPATCLVLAYKVKVISLYCGPIPALHSLLAQHCLTVKRMNCGVAPGASPPGGDSEGHTQLSASAAVQRQRYQLGRPAAAARAHVTRTGSCRHVAPLSLAGQQRSAAAAAGACRRRRN